MADEHYTSQKLITCPYNSSHQILPHRIQTHLKKCEKQYPHLNLEKCIFNSCHRIEPGKMKLHQQDCPDRLEWEKQQNIIEVRTSSSGSLSSSGVVMQKPISYNDDDEEEAGENWDEDVGQFKYDPRKAAAQKPILRNNIGLTPAQKRQFKQEEFERLKRFHGSGSDNNQK